MSWRAYLTVIESVPIIKRWYWYCFTKNEPGYTIRKTLIIAHCSDTLFSSKYWTSWRKRQRSAVSAVICWTNNQNNLFLPLFKNPEVLNLISNFLSTNLHWWDKVIKIKLNWTWSTLLTFARLCLSWNLIDEFSQWVNDLNMFLFLKSLTF